MVLEVRERKRAIMMDQCWLDLFASAILHPKGVIILHETILEGALVILIDGGVVAHPDICW